LSLNTILAVKSRSDRFWKNVIANCVANLMVIFALFTHLLDGVRNPKRLSLDEQSPHKPVANSFVLGCYMLQQLVFVTSKISRNFAEFCAMLTVACLIVRQVALVVCDCQHKLLVLHSLLFL